MAATAPRIAWGYLPGCFRPQVGLGVLAWLLQAPGWSGGTGMAAIAPESPGGTGLAATAHRGYWPGCYSLRMAWGNWPGC